MNAALEYVSDSDPGITRRRCGRGFSYRAPDGTTIDDPNERGRIAALAVPPAYEDVWICALPNGHLQATGRDARHRKQYRYHPQWSAARSETKFDRLTEFGALLPTIRRRVDRDLKAPPGAQAFALASAIMLIDRASLRVGNREYARQNGSFGATTLRGRHVTAKGGAVKLRFTAKGGKKVRQTLVDAKLHRVLQKVNDLPGATLLTWVDDAGQLHTLSSEGLNGYLSDISGGSDVTAKTFRTWAGTVEAFGVAEAGNATIKDMTAAAAERLHNTPTVARNSYVHPRVLDLAGQAAPAIEPVSTSGLTALERRLMGYLQNVA